MRVQRVIPALPVRRIATATDFWSDHLRFTVAHQEPGFAILTRDDVEIHLWTAEDTDWQTRDDLREKPVRSGAESFIAGTASCRIAVDTTASLNDLHHQLTDTKALHSRSTAGPTLTDYGMAELHILDPDGNLVTFFAALTPSV